MRYKYLIFIVTIYVSAILISAALAYKIIGSNTIYTTAGIITIPISFLICDIAAEVYGYQIARQIIWAGILAEGLFTLFCELSIHLPSPNFWHHQTAYNFVLGHLFHIYISGLVAAFVGSIINIYLISKWKVLLRGKYFWLRSIGSSFSGELIFTIICDTMMFLYVIPVSKILTIIVFSFSMKAVYSFFITFPASFFAWLLKRSEKTDTYDININYNPFKLAIENQASTDKI